MVVVLGVYMVWVVVRGDGVGGYRGVAWLYAWRVEIWGALHGVGVGLDFLGGGLTCGGGWGMMHTLGNHCWPSYFLRLRFRYEGQH